VAYDEYTVKAVVEFNTQTNPEQGEDMAKSNAYLELKQRLPSGHDIEIVSVEFLETVVENTID
jgi:hypothetical protein